MNNTWAICRHQNVSNANRSEKVVQRQAKTNWANLVGSVAIVFLGLAIVSGCDSNFSGPEPTPEVSGKVTLDGQPLADTKIVFVPYRLYGPDGMKRQISYAVTDAQGEFSLKRGNNDLGTHLGMHRVVISKKKTEGVRTGRLEVADLELFSSEFSELSQPADELIPTIYNLHSILTFKVDVTTSQADFELSSVDPLLKK